MSDKNLPPLTDFEIFVVAWATSGFFDLAPTAIPRTGAKLLIVGLRNEIQAFWLPLNIFFILFLKPAPSSWNWFGVKVIRFWHLHLGLGHKSCTLSKLPLIFKPHHERLLVRLERLFLNFADFWNFFSAILFIYHSLSKKLWFVTTTHFTFSFINFNEILCFRAYFFRSILIHCLAKMASSWAKNLVLIRIHLIIRNFIFGRSRGLNINIFFLSKFK